MSIKKYNIKKILTTILWMLIGSGVIVLLGAGVNKKENKRCKSIEINISGVQNIVFIDEKDVMNIIENVNGGKVEGKPVKLFNLANIEKALEQNEWIKNAEVYFDNNEKFWVNINEREPVARVFTLHGNSFYIDTSLTIIPLSEKFSARLPVFTGFPDSLATTKEDSILLNDIKNISSYIVKDSFWMAQIDQVDINRERTFELIPKIGNQQIIFGDATNYQQKFQNLFSFYKNIQAKVGWNKYSKIDVQYKGQIIAVKRGVEDIKMDSLRTVQIMQMILANAQHQLGDTSSIQLTQTDENTQQLTPFVNDDLPDENAGSFTGNKIVVIQETEKPIISTELKPVASAISKPATTTIKPAFATIKKDTAVKKPVVKNTIIPKPVAIKQIIKKEIKPINRTQLKPKTVMQKSIIKKSTNTKPKNEY